MREIFNDELSEERQKLSSEHHPRNFLRLLMVSGVVASVVLGGMTWMQSKSKPWQSWPFLFEEKSNKKISHETGETSTYQELNAKIPVILPVIEDLSKKSEGSVLHNDQIEKRCTENTIICANNITNKPYELIQKIMALTPIDYGKKYRIHIDVTPL